MLLSEQVMKNAVMEGNSGYPIVASVLEPMISPPADGQGILGGMVIGDIQLEIKPLDEATSQKTEGAYRQPRYGFVRGLYAAEHDCGGEPAVSAR
jgi:hypothetical protein